MKEHRDALKKAADANWKKKEDASQAPPKEAFKMRQFQNVQSRLRDDRQQQSARDDVRAQTAEGQAGARGFSARERRTYGGAVAGVNPGATGGAVAFGRGRDQAPLMRRTGSFSGMKKDIVTPSGLSKNALDQFNKRTSKGV